MLRVLLTGLFVAMLASACASAPAKPSANESQAAKAPVVATTVVPEKKAGPAAVLPIDPHGELKRGRCVDCFDCVDTVGFPAPGFRWACVNGKCERAKLLGFTGQGQPAEVVSNSEPAKHPLKASRSGRRNN
jgi:hypothetical protein